MELVTLAVAVAVEVPLAGMLLGVSDRRMALAGSGVCVSLAVALMFGWAVVSVAVMVAVSTLVEAVMVAV